MRHLFDRSIRLAPWCAIPVIVVTARDLHRYRERFLQAGARAFLQKPVDNDELLAVIRTCLGENHGSE